MLVLDKNPIIKTKGEVKQKIMFTQFVFLCYQLDKNNCHDEEHVPFCMIYTAGWLFF